MTMWFMHLGVCGFVLAVVMQTLCTVFEHVYVDV